MERIHEFIKDGKQFFYIDFSDFETKDVIELIESGKKIMVKHAEQSVYTITNVKDIKYTLETKDALSEWVEHNKPYVKSGAVIGLDAPKKIVANMIAILTKRKNLVYADTKEEAIEILLKKD